MKKRIGIVVLCLLLFSFGCTKKENGSDEMASWKTIPYYKDAFLERYQQYQQKNPSFTQEEVVTRVNLRLDVPFYSETEVAPSPHSLSVLVNKVFFLPSDFVPDQLELIRSQYSNGSKYLVKEAKDAFEKMAEDAEQEGFRIRAISSYRSYSYQLGLYQRYKDTDGKAVADTYSARPGFSEHQTGLVVDIDNGSLDFNSFEKTKEFSWMQENSSRYGFILRYPKGKEEITGYTYEAWHYRYVGVELAQEIQKSGLTFDEYAIRYLMNQDKEKDT